MVHGKRIFITGGAGFIGTALVERLIQDNQITIYDNLHRNALQHSAVAGHPNLTVIRGDVLDRATLAEAFGHPDIVFHLAAIAGVPTVVAHPTTTLSVNIIGTYNVLEVAKDAKIERFIDFSTSEVYGPHVFRADEEGMTTQGPSSQPRWVYAVSKLASEFLSVGYHREYGLPTTVIRPFNIYGPQQIGEGAVHHFIVRALQGEDLEVHNDGNQIRSWCYIDDMVDALQRVLESPAAVGQVLNIGNPQATCTNLSLAETIIGLAGSPSKITFKMIEYPDVEVRVPSVEKAYRVLSWQPRWALADGLKNTVNWYRAHLQRTGA